MEQQTKMPIEAVIFDLDGTLATFNLDYKALRGEVRSYLIQKNIPPSVLKVNESIFEMLKKTQLYTRKAKNPEIFEELRTHSLALAEKYELEAAETTSLLPGVAETLKELQRLNLKIGLCTSNSEKAAAYILNRFKIAEYFQVLVARDKVKDVKPHIEQFEVALNTLKAAKEATVIVGDSTVDMQSAKELKALSVGYPTGFSTKEQLMTSGANYIITSLTDLPLLIKKLNQN
ncbi:MAG: HAD family hydrolase [Candidatus Bathyarchaeota archaeon]|nr:HAD family hydrolase [Candidatus Bathyarchaeota archaeon]